MLNDIAVFVAERLRERSTWSSIFSALSLIGVALAPDLQEGITLVGLAVAGYFAGTRG